MWVELIKKYWQVSIFKQTPANTPYSTLLLVGIAFFFLVLITVQWLIADIKQELNFSVALLEAVALLFSYVLYTYIVLAIFQVSSRFVQTLSCIFAGHAIVHLFASPLLIAIPLLAKENLPAPFGLIFGIVYLILTLLLTAWQFMLTAYIYKQALDTDYLRAVFASLGLLAANILIISLWH